MSKCPYELGYSPPHPQLIWVSYTVPQNLLLKLGELFTEAAVWSHNRSAFFDIDVGVPERPPAGRYEVGHHRGGTPTPAQVTMYKDLTPSEQRISCEFNHVQEHPVHVRCGLVLRFYRQVLDSLREGVGVLSGDVDYVGDTQVGYDDLVGRLVSPAQVQLAGQDLRGILQQQLLPLTFSPHHLITTQEGVVLVEGVVTPFKYERVQVAGGEVGHDGRHQAVGEAIREPVSVV